MTIITLIALAVMTIASVSNSVAGSDFKTVDAAQLHSMIKGYRGHFSILDKHEYMRRGDTLGHPTLLEVTLIKNLRRHSWVM